MRYLFRFIPFLILIAFTLSAEAQLFEDLDKRDNALNKEWVYGVNAGAAFVLYTIDREMVLTAHSVDMFSRTYSGVGIHVGGQILRSFDRFKVGIAPSFQSFAGTDKGLITLPGDPDFSTFDAVSIHNLNINARFEIYFTSSNEGGAYINLEGGPSFLSGDIPGDDVGVVLNGTFGVGYDFRLTDKVNLTFEFDGRILRFKNQFLNEEYRHRYYAIILAVGLRF